LGKKGKIKEFGPQWRTKEHEGKQKIVFSNHLRAPLCAFVVNYPLNFWRIDRLPGTKSLYALALPCSSFRLTFDLFNYFLIPSNLRILLISHAAFPPYILYIKIFMEGVYAKTQ
jgi:hypothetical protein